jgi:hypothetical protein
MKKNYLTPDMELNIMSDVIMDSSVAKDVIVGDDGNWDTGVEV